VFVQKKKVQTILINFSIQVITKYNFFNMLNIGKPLPKDHAEVAKHVKARLFDEERKKRIFNPTIRTIGVSYYENLLKYFLIILF